MSFEEIAIVSVNCVSYRINFYASKDKPVARLKKYIMTKKVIKLFFVLNIEK